jgi:hypothetical protein
MGTICHGRRLMLWELVVSLNVLSERVQHKVSVKLGMSQTCTRLIPRDLSNNQELMPMEFCQ